jgi:hypothetical protein
MKMLERQRTDLITIPCGLASTSEPLDVSMNKPVKGHTSVLHGEDSSRPLHMHAEWKN